VGEVAVEGPGFLDPELQHRCEAQAVDGAVALVLVLFQVGEGFELLLEARKSSWAWACRSRSSAAKRAKKKPVSTKITDRAGRCTDRGGRRCPRPRAPR
jgi:hypothetical protein